MVRLRTTDSDDPEVEPVHLVLVGSFPVALLIIGWAIIILSSNIGLNISKNSIDSLVVTSIVIFYADLGLESFNLEQPIPIGISVLIGGYANIIYISDLGVIVGPLLFFPVTITTSFASMYYSNISPVIVLMAGVTLSVIAYHTTAVIWLPQAYLESRLWLGIGFGVPMCISSSVWLLYLKLTTISS